LGGGVGSVVVGTGERVRADKVVNTTCGPRSLSLGLEILERLDHVLQAGDVLAQDQPVPQRPVVRRAPRVRRHHVPAHGPLGLLLLLVDGVRHLAQDLRAKTKTEKKKKN